MISRKFLNAYQNEVEQASKEASLYVKSAYQVFMEENPNASFVDIRNYVLEAINDSLSIFGGQASLIANDFFDQLAQLAGEDMTSEMYENVNTEPINRSLHYYAKNLVEGHNEKFEKNIVDLTAYHVKREAFENLKYNCKKNGIKYARVPSGRETCAFCFILASRGFCYDSEFSAGGKGNYYHPHCDCIIVPGFGLGSGVNPDTQIEGYKPTEMQKRYYECCKTVDGITTYENYRKSGAYEKYDYNFSDWKYSIISSEIRKRDNKWLYSGLNTRYKVLKDADPLPHEIDTANRLSFHGYKITFKPKRDREDMKSADTYFETADGKMEVEFKSPIGGGNQTIYHQFEEAVGQSHNLLIDLNRSSLSFEKAYEDCRKVKNWHYIIDSGFNKGELWRFDRVYLLDKENKIHLIV